MKFHLVKAIGYGVLIWALMFAFVSLIVGFDIRGSFWMSGVMVLVAGALSYAFAAGAKPYTGFQAISYGFLWVVVGVLLDILISARFAEGIFTSLSYWVGYFLVLVAPWIKYELDKPSRVLEHESRGHIY